MAITATCACAKARSPGGRDVCVRRPPLSRPKSPCGPAQPRPFTGAGLHFTGVSPPVSSLVSPLSPGVAQVAQGVVRLSRPEVSEVYTRLPRGPTPNHGPGHLLHFFRSEPFVRSLELSVPSRRDQGSAPRGGRRQQGPPCRPLRLRVSVPARVRLGTSKSARAEKCVIGFCRDHSPDILRLCVDGRLLLLHCCDAGRGTRRARDGVLHEPHPLPSLCAPLWAAVSCRTGPAPPLLHDDDAKSADLELQVKIGRP